MCLLFDKYTKKCDIYDTNELSNLSGSLYRFCIVKHANLCDNHHCCQSKNNGGVMTKLTAMGFIAVEFDHFKISGAVVKFVCYLPPNPRTSCPRTPEIQIKKQGVDKNKYYACL
jgi:hypothetical protein